MPVDEGSSAAQLQPERCNMSIDQLDIRDMLEQMAGHVRLGNAEAAAALGNRCQPPLAIAANDITLQQKLGQGSESTIYAAQYRSSPVAVKKYIIRSTADLQRYRKEVAILSSVQHQHVVPLLGARALAPTYAMVIPRYERSLEVCACFGSQCKRNQSMCALPATLLVDLDTSLLPHFCHLCQAQWSVAAMSSLRSFLRRSQTRYDRSK